MYKTPTSDLEYVLDESSIAQYRYKEPANSKLLIASTNEILTFKNFLNELKDKSVFVFNKSTIHNVRIETTKSHSGGKIEFFILNILDSNTAEVMIKTSSNLKPSDIIDTPIATVSILDKSEGIFTVDFKKDVRELIQKFGKVPLPPYINDNSSKYDDYKNEFSEGGFSVATSTAGLHFTLDMIADLQNNGHKVFFLNLDINLGTFKQIHTKNIEDYEIHSEFYKVSDDEFNEILDLKEIGYKVVAVGTTVLRTLETVFTSGIYEGKTNLFITPGYKFNIPDFLITNFHAPRSSLLSIVQTIYGSEWKKLYEYAQKNNLKFLSFGDAVLFKIDEQS